MSENRNENFIYLNTAGVGLSSNESVSAAHDFQLASMTDPHGVFMKWMQNDLPKLREDTGKLINTHPDNIAFTPNFSFSLLAIIDALKGNINRVLLYKDDYPSLNLPFELGGFDISYVENKDGFEIPMDELEEIAVRDKVEVIAISHVQFLTGFTLELKRLSKFCKDRNIILIVDTTQSMGAVPFDFDALNIDVTISSSYKWLNGGLGSAVLAVKESFMKKFPPKTAGFGSMTMTPEGWEYKPSLASYQPGHLNPLGLLQLQKGIEQRLNDTVEAVHQHNYGLIKRLAAGLDSAGFKVTGGPGAENLSTLICFEAPQEVHNYLIENQISTTWRKGKIRIGPHFYNTEKEIDTLLDLLKNFSKNN